MIRGDSGRFSGQIQSPSAVVRFAANISQKDVQLSDDQIRLPATPLAAMRTPLPAISERVERFVRGSLSLDLRGQGGFQSQIGQTVLLVEDNDINMRVSLCHTTVDLRWVNADSLHQLLLALMGKLKLESECAVNGFEALEKYKAAPARFFLVLMDMNMPVRSSRLPKKICFLFC